MAPLSSQSSAASPNAKRKQPTIASFFTKKPEGTQRSQIIGDFESKNHSPDSVCSENIQSRRPRSVIHQNVSNNQDDLVPPPSKRARTNGFRPSSADDERTSQTSITSSQRTDRFRFTNLNPDEEVQESKTNRVESYVDEDISKDRERLHQRFVKKLGGPDCLIGIGKIQAESGVAADAADDDDTAAADDDEEPVPHRQPTSRGKGGSKKSAGKLTPLEKQVIEIKRKHMDTVLVVEVGYKFRFFGEDARIAAKELGIVCIPGKIRFDEHPSETHLDRFASASIPVHRLHVHVKRLVTAGYKVGVVRQLETAALKAAGDNRNAPFVRKLTNLYTKGTYVDDVEGPEGTTSAALDGGTPATGYMLCMTEKPARGWGNDEKVHVGIIAVQPATGDIMYDDFEDGFMRSEIETRLLHIAPCEVLIVGDLSKATERLVQHLSESNMTTFDDKVRVERSPKTKTAAAESYSHVSSFYAEKMTAMAAEQNEQASNLLQRILPLPEQVTICLSAIIKHMSEYGLDHVFDLTKYFQPFSARSHMLINGNTLISLEIYQNQTDHTSKGSLLWMLDRTQTRFGHRLLRKWVGRPLLDKSKLQERQDAVEELKSPERSLTVERLRALLGKIKTDLEKTLIRIYYGKCTRPELVTFLQTMQTIAMQFSEVESPTDTGFQSPLIGQALATLPTVLKFVSSFLDKINMAAARNDNKYEFFRESEETEEISEHKLGIAGIEHDLQEHRAFAASKLGKTKVDYATSSGIEYLIEIENNSVAMKKVPASWIKVSGTRKVSRFHTPEVIQLIRQRDQHKESLAAACDKAYSALLADISAHYPSFRDCIQWIATLDCLLSLSTIAGLPGYVRPVYADDTCICVEQGRHPMIEQLLLDSYVPNDISLETDRTRALLITGPNMGGKSSFVRQVALIAIMGQIGSYVPAQSAKLGMLDAVFTRMGAFDNMLAGESTFMVELSESADILKHATPRSLVILDELGRGTSTHDGAAIAQAVLDYMVRSIRSLTLFITHYQHLSRMAGSFPNRELRNVHMRFTESNVEGKDDDITFLYEVGEGVAHRSYGLNVARLANLPSSVLDMAKLKSAELEEKIRYRRLKGLAAAVGKIADEPTWGDEGIIERLITQAELL